MRNLIISKLLKDGFKKVCTLSGGCQYHHPNGERCKVVGNKLIKLKNWY